MLNFCEIGLRDERIFHIFNNLTEVSAGQKNLHLIEEFGSKEKAVVNIGIFASRKKIHQNFIKL